MAAKEKCSEEPKNNLKNYAKVWFIVRNTQGVTGFIGSSGKGAKPIPLLPEEVDRILMEGTKKAREVAKTTMSKVRKAMKIDYFNN